MRNPFRRPTELERIIERELADARADRAAEIEAELDLDRDLALAADYVSGALSPDANAAFDARVERDPAFRDAVTPLLSVWSLPRQPAQITPERLESALARVHASSDFAPVEARHEPRTPEEIAYAERVRVRRMAPRSRGGGGGGSGGGGRSFLHYALVAAAVFFVMMGGTALFTKIYMATHVPNNRLTTGAGESFVVTLGEGTRISMGPRSHLAYPVDLATAARRDLLFDGNATFEVAHRAGGGSAPTPFTVTTPTAVVTVTGTVFTIRAPRGVPVTLIAVQSGVVVVHARTGGTSVKLTAGQHALVRGAAVPR